VSGGFGLALLVGLGCSGSGSSPPSYQPVSATNENALYTIEMGSLKMVVDASAGARITEFSLGGMNVLTGTDVNSFDYGSTYWPSPQSSWCTAGGGCWPPIAAIDTQPYTGSIDAGTNTVQLTSGEASIAGFAGSAVTISKQFTPVPDSGAIDVTYTLANTSPSVAVSVAAWQISRVEATGGLTFFGQGGGAPSYASGSDATFAVTEAGGDLWYDFSPVGSNSKMLADGAGWIAHVTKSRLLYLLAYPDVPPTEAAPGEAEVEIFTGTGGDYVELETQGALTDVAPGDTLVWTVRWKLRQVPSGTSVAVGNPGLTSFASIQLAQ
jgi:hypothetical protein